MKKMQLNWVQPKLTLILHCVLYEKFIKMRRRNATQPILRPLQKMGQNGTTLAQPRTHTSIKGPTDQLNKTAFYRVAWTP